MMKSFVGMFFSGAVVALIIYLFEVWYTNHQNNSIDT